MDVGDIGILYHAVFGIDLESLVLAIERDVEDFSKYETATNIYLVRKDSPIQSEYPLESMCYCTQYDRRKVLQRHVQLESSSAQFLQSHLSKMLPLLEQVHSVKDSLHRTSLPRKNLSDY